ncbi:hypothetical protein Tco_0795141 [Tanacetum coccineum]
MGTNQWNVGIDDCIDLDGMERSILAKVKDLSVISELLKHMSSEGFDDVGLRYVGGRWVWLEFDSMDQVESVKTSKALQRTWWVCHWASWAPDVLEVGVGGRWGKKQCFYRYGNDVDHVHGKVCSPYRSLYHLGFCERRNVRGVESDLWDAFEEGRFVMIRSCIMIGVIVGNVTIDDNEDVTPVIAPEKDSIIAPPSTPPGNDLNIAAESGSSWIDYIGPLTSDEIDSE